MIGSKAWNKGYGMSFSHAIYIGNFERDEDKVRFAIDAEDGMLKPVVAVPIDLELARRLATSHAEPGSPAGPLPESWRIWPEAGCLVCDRYALGQDAVEFLKTLVEAMGCVVVDFNARDVIPIRELVATVAQPSAGSIHADGLARTLDDFQTVL